MYLLNSALKIVLLFVFFYSLVNILIGLVSFFKNLRNKEKRTIAGKRIIKSILIFVFVFAIIMVFVIIYGVFFHQIVSFGRQSPIPY